MKKFLTAMAALALIAGGYLLSGHRVPAAKAAGRTYSGMAYVAGMGGHFAAIDLTIDPSGPEPIKVNNLDRIIIGGKDDHAVHDPRIDLENRNIMYWATYHKDPGGKLHVGKSDLRTGKVIMDEAVSPDPRATETKHCYCASGQSKTSYLPVTMTDEAYIDVRDKKTMKLLHRVFLDKLGYKNHNYLFFHGTNTPDMKEFVVAVNRMTNGKPNGNVDFVLLDMKSLLEGRIKVIARNTLSGSPGDTITFRQNFTPDGKYLLQAAGDRFWVIDAKTLKLVDQHMFPATGKASLKTEPGCPNGQNHDAISTPDGRYALLTVRVPHPGPGGKLITDGVLQLYSLQRHEMVGPPVSICGGCHYKYGLYFSAALCGIDTNWKK
ncbi:MAG: hypothetical protein M0Z75_15810 [Nitrospiraceae bacterium]|nr:hypothetical protein [Nitrospiraceae bacterium]